MESIHNPFRNENRPNTLKVMWVEDIPYTKFKPSSKKTTRFTRGRLFFNRSKDILNLSTKYAEPVSRKPKLILKLFSKVLEV